MKFNKNLQIKLKIFYIKLSHYIINKYIYIYMNIDSLLHKKTNI